MASTVARSIEELSEDLYQVVPAEVIRRRQRLQENSLGVAYCHNQAGGLLA